MIKNSNIIITGATSGIGFELVKKLGKIIKLLQLERLYKLNALKKP